MARMILQQFKPEGDRILAGGLCHLVKEGLDRIGRVGRTDRAPPQHRNAGLHARQPDAQVGDRIGQIGGTFDRGEVDAVLDCHALEGGARHDRLADDVVRPGGDIALGIETRLHRMHIGWTVTPALHVVIARPLHFYRPRPAEGFRHLNRLRHHIGIEHRAPAKAAAGAHHMQLHLVWRHTGDLRRDILIEVRHLVPGPDLDDSILHLRHRVQWLERRMGQIGESKCGLERFRRGRNCTCRIAIVAGDGEWRGLRLGFVSRKNFS